MRLLPPVLAVLLTACQQNPPLDRFEILRVIQNEKNFQQPLLLSVARVSAAGCGQAVSITKGWRRLIDLGIIGISEIRSGCEAALTSDARQILGIRPTDARLTPNLEIPSARRNIVSLDRQDAVGGGVEVRFSWNWDPNEIGRRVGLPAKVLNGRAEIQLVRDTWAAIRVELDESPDPLR